MISPEDESFPSGTAPGRRPVPDAPIEAPLSRRAWLKLAGAALLGLALPACSPPSQAGPATANLASIWLDALNSRDWERLSRLHAEGVVWYPARERQPVAGRQAVLDELKRQLELRSIPEAVHLGQFHQDEWVCLQYVYPGRIADASQCSVFQVQENRIQAWYEYHCQTDPANLQPAMQPVAGGQPAQVEENLARVEEWTAALNARDWSRFEALHAGDVTFYACERPDPVRGTAAVLEELQDFMGPQPETRLEKINAFGQVDWVCVQFRLLNQQFNICEVFEFQAGRVRSIYDYISEAAI